MREIDSLAYFERFSIEVAGSNLTEEEAYPGARHEFLLNCLIDAETESNES